MIKELQRLQNQLHDILDNLEHVEHGIYTQDELPAGVDIKTWPECDFDVELSAIGQVIQCRLDLVNEELQAQLRGKE